MTKQETIKNNYLMKLDELNVLIEETQNNKEKKTSDEAYDDFTEWLIEAYIMGSSNLDYLLDIKTTLKQDLLEKALNYFYDGVSIKDKFNEYYQKDDSKLARLIESEWHRCFNQGSYDSAKQSNKNLVKVWKTMLDDKVRDTHWYLEDIEAPIDEYFITYDDDKALYPSGFTKAQNNANCRCYLEYKEV